MEFPGHGVTLTITITADVTSAYLEDKISLVILEMEKEGNIPKVRSQFPTTATLDLPQLL